MKDYDRAVEVDWERVHPLQPPSPDEIAGWLNQAGLPPPRDWAVLLGGKANTNLQVRLVDGSAVVLRVHTRDPGGAAREAALSRLVAETVPVPRFLWVSDAGWSVQEWVDGKSLEVALGEGESVSGTQMGRVLAAIGRYVFPVAGFLSPELEVTTPIGPPVDGYLGYVSHLLGQERVRERLGTPLANAALARVEDCVPAVASLDPTPRLVHSDFKPSNLIVRDGALVGVVDWEFAHAGHPLLDVALLFRDDRLAHSAFRSDFAKAYRDAGGELPDRWLEIARVLDFVNLCDFLSREEAGGNLMNDCVTRIQQTLSEPYLSE